MQYSLESYDSNGFLKPPKLLWLGWIFLAKAWVVFILAGVSQQSGSEILSTLYPDHQVFYVGLTAGLPSIVLMWLVSLRSAKRPFINRVVCYGRGITIVTACLQLVQTCYAVYLSNGQFSWSNGLSLLGLFWLLLYLNYSRFIRDSFSESRFHQE